MSVQRPTEHDVNKIIHVSIYQDRAVYITYDVYYKIVM